MPDTLPSLYQYMEKQQIRLRTILLHIFFWAIFFAVPVFFAPTPRHMEALDLPFYYYIPFIASCIALIIIFYLNYYIFVPRLYFKKRFGLFGLVLGATLFMLVAVPEIDHLFEEPKFEKMAPAGESSRVTQELQLKDPGQMRMSNGPRRHHGGGFNRFIHFSPFEMQVFFMGIIVVILSMFLRISRRLKEAENEKVTAELSFLKAQINPHFLFNTLNSIYSLAYKKSEQTAPALIKLSSMMRYVISEVQAPFVPLQKEIDYMSNYLSLQKLRLADTVDVKCMVNGSPEGKVIAPMLFIPFIENAFKYGVNPERPSSIRIRLEITENALQFDVENSNLNQGDQPSERVGIGNTKERLELIYPGRYLLNIRHTPEEHHVSLHIQLA